MASDNKNDTSSNEDQAADTSKSAESSSKTSSGNPPPILSDTVSPESAASSKAKPKPAQESKVKTAPQKAAKEKKSGRAIGWLALLIALVALVGVAYGLWMLQQAKDNKSVEQNRLSQSQSQLVDSFKTSTQLLSDQVKGFISKADNQQARISELQTQLQATNRQIGEVTQVSRRSWMLAEAEYLLRLANQRLLMERETVSALALLSSADEILVSVAEPGLFDAREALARETAALRAIAHLDVEGIFVKLAALSEQVETLALLTPNGGEQEEVVKPMLDEEQQSVFDAALDRFGNMVSVRHRDVPLEPLLTPEQHYYVQQNLRLMLEQAQLALLQRNAGVYSRSLDKASNWVELYFQLNESAQALRATLRELQPVDVDPELPNISASLALLKAYIRTPLPGDNSPAAASVPSSVTSSIKVVPAGTDASSSNSADGAAQ
jgi:uroporphyrin-III C-methyltransferase